MSREPLQSLSVWSCIQDLLRLFLAPCLISEPRLDMFIKKMFFPRSHFCLLSFGNSLAHDS